MKFFAGLVVLFLPLGSVLATVSVWGQCGGSSYTGDTSEFFCNNSKVQFNILILN